jgi:mono/diheme cytochrome c family protein
MSVSHVPAAGGSRWLARLALAWVMASAGSVPAALAAADTAPSPPKSAGEQIYAERCAQCHEGGVPKAPHKMFLQMMATDAIHAALTTGIMQQQATGLDAAAKVAVAEYLGGQSLADSRTSSFARVGRRNSISPSHPRRPAGAWTGRIAASSPPTWRGSRPPISRN